MKQVFHIETSDHVSIIKPALHIRTGQHHFSFAITEYESKLLKKLSYYTDDEGINADTLGSIINQTPELAGSYFLINICYDIAGNMLMPVKPGLPMDEKGPRNLTPPGYISLSEEINQWNVTNVYFVPESIYHCLKKVYPNASIYHDAKVVLENTKVKPGEAILKVDFRQNEFSVIAIKDTSLYAFQIFEYAAPEDVIYYLLSMCSQFSFAQKEVNLVLSGLIEKQSALYRELYHYFIHISFHEADWNTGMIEYPPHFFTSLNELAKCG